MCLKIERKSTARFTLDGEKSRHDQHKLRSWRNVRRQDALNPRFGFVRIDEERLRIGSFGLIAGGIPGRKPQVNFVGPQRRR